MCLQKFIWKISRPSSDILYFTDFDAMMTEFDFSEEDEDDSEDEESNIHDEQFFTDFRNFKAGYYRDKLEFQDVNQWVSLCVCVYVW